MPTAGVDVYFGSACGDEPGWDMTSDPAKHETWLDPPWTQPNTHTPERLILNRDEFIARLRKLQDAPSGEITLAPLELNVKESDLRYWEYEGILPKPVRKWDPEVKARRAYYPVWLIASIITLRELQREGYQLRDIAPVLPAAAIRAAEMLAMIFDPEPPPDFFDRAITEDDVINGFIIAEAIRTVTDKVFYTEVVPSLERYARLHERYGANETRGIDLRFEEVGGGERRAGFVMRDKEGRYRTHRYYENRTDSI